MSSFFDRKSRIYAEKMTVFLKICGAIIFAYIRVLFQVILRVLFCKIPSCGDVNLNVILKKKREKMIMYKKITAFLAVLAASFTFFSVTVHASQNDGTKLIAHRGYSGIAPENTLAAARLAGEHGFDACEFDVWPTADRVWVVMHDDTLDRMTDGTGAIADKTLAELRTLRIDAGNGIENYPDEKIPTLNEMLEVCKKAGIMPVIEIKNGDAENLETLACQLDASGITDKCTVISFERDCLIGMRRLLPTLDLRLLIGKVTKESIAFCVKNKINGISCNYKSNLPHRYKPLRESGLKMTAWTVNDLANANNLADQGFEYITTDALVPGTVNAHGEHSVKADITTILLRIWDNVPAFLKNALKGCGVAS